MMGADTLIEWADCTFNPWVGCTAVSPACDSCYAERLAKRLGVAWGPHAERRRTAESTWRQPLAWNRKAQREGRRYRVFCASLSDVFDNAVPIEWLVDALDVIRTTPRLDWLLLTKRPQLIRRRLVEALTALSQGTERGDLLAWLAIWLHGTAPANVWLGTTAESQREAEQRIPPLLAVDAALHFLSCEPLLGGLNLMHVRARDADGNTMFLDALAGEHYYPGCGSISSQTFTGKRKVGWAIAGGESGPKARPTHPDWARSLRDQCQAAGVPYFWKQWGEHVPCVREDVGDRLACCPDGADSPAFADDARHPIVQAHGREYWRVGKKRAGAMLDGREWREVPGA